MTSPLQVLSGANQDALRANSYPGRGVVVGLDESGRYAIEACWLMGRSAESRNRVYIVDGGRVYTVPADPSKAKPDPNLFYDAMDEHAGQFVVSNGHQTEALITDLKQFNTPTVLSAILSEWSYEDDLSYTPRITGSVVPSDSPMYELSILRPSPFSDACDRHYYDYDEGGIGPGFGYCLHTYEGDGHPLLPFRGKPFLLPLVGSAKEILATYWGILNEANKVSLAVKSIDLATGGSRVVVANKYR